MLKGKDEFLFYYGVHPVTERLKGSPEGVVELCTSKENRRAIFRTIEEMARSLGIRVRRIESFELDRLSGGGRHQGIGVKVSSFVYSQFTEILSEGSFSRGARWILVLDGITNPGNFGSLLRTSEGLGVHDVIIPKDRSVGITPTVLKTSAGAVLHQKIYRVPNLRRAIADLKETGYWVVGLDPAAPEKVGERVFPEKLVVVLGSEGSGVRPSIREACDFLVSIPMRGEIASLNVAVAGAIILYELCRQLDFSS